MTGRSVWRAEGRSLAEKGWEPLSYWTSWFSGVGVTWVRTYCLPMPN